MARVKLCGLRREQDAEYANLCMPDYAGMVFAPGKRQVGHETAARLRRLLHPDIQTVGVFVNAQLEEILALVQAGAISLVQLHGDEDEAYTAALKARTDAPIIRMVPVGDSLPPLPTNADYILFDTLSPKRGGTGQRFNWDVLQGYAGPPYFLAGGLTPQNVGDALAQLTPYALDTSSGIETDGCKDLAKMQAFTNIVRSKEHE